MANILSVDKFIFIRTVTCTLFSGHENMSLLETRNILNIKDVYCELKWKSTKNKFQGEPLRRKNEENLVTHRICGGTGRRWVQRGF